MRAVTCPECDAVIDVDSDTAGRRVGCPECGTRFTVPERGERRRPGAKKKRRKTAAGPNWGLIVGLALGGVALIGGVVFVLQATRPKPAAQTETAGKSGEQGGPTGGGDGPFKLSLPTGSGEKSAPAPAPPPLPPGWAKYTLREASLTAYFPGDPGESAEGSADMGVRVTDYMWDYELPNMGGGFSMTAMLLPTGTTLRADQEAVFLRYPRHALEKQAMARFVAERAATFGRFPATELEYVLPTGEPVVTRYGFVRSGERQMFVVATAGGKAVTPADRAAFFDSVRPAN